MSIVTPPPVNELNRELDVLLAHEDNTVNTEAAALLASATARVRSERLAGTNPNGAPLYEKKVVVDGTAVQLSKQDPLKTLLTTPKLPAELVEHLPAETEGPGTLP